MVPEPWHCLEAPVCIAHVGMQTWGWGFEPGNGGHGSRWIDGWLGPREAVDGRLLQIARGGFFEGPVKKVLSGIILAEKGGRLEPVVQEAEWVFAKSLEKLQHKKGGTWVRWSPSGIIYDIMARRTTFSWEEMERGAVVRNFFCGGGAGAAASGSQLLTVTVTVTVTALLVASPSEASLPLPLPLPLSLPLHVVVNRQGGANARRTRLSNGHELWKGPSSTGHRSVVLPSPRHALAFAVLLPNLSYIMSHYGAHQRGPVGHYTHAHVAHADLYAAIDTERA